MTNIKEDYLINITSTYKVEGNEETLNIKTTGTFKEKENKKYLVEGTITLNNYNLSSIKNNIKSGYIIFINDNVSLYDFKILVRQIYYQDLNIIFVSDLLKEERD